MMRLALWSVVVALVVVAVGCASSHNAAGQGSSVSLHFQGEDRSATSGKRVDLASVRRCLERHGWPVERVSHNEIDSQHGAVVWDMEFRHSRLISVGWTGSTNPARPSVLNHCLYSG
jgi:hypothetical protein